MRDVHVARLREPTMNNDLLCRMSALCDGILPLAGAVAAFAGIALMFVFA